jgi:ribosome maturation factor RimP
MHRNDCVEQAFAAIIRRVLCGLPGKFGRIENGQLAHFSFVALVMKVFELIEQTVGGLGYELVDVETSPRGRLLRVFIDKPLDDKGVSIDDCTAVSNQLSRLFAVEEVDYDRLEVSSPGMDRTLKKAADFERFAGQEVQIKLRLPVGKQRNFSGVIAGMRDDRVILQVGSGADAIEHEFPLATVDKARLVPKF